MKTQLSSSNKRNTAFDHWIATAKSNVRKINSKKALYLMLLPGIIYFIIFKYIPMYGVIIAFKDYNFAKGIMGSPWVGLRYFEVLLQTNEFYRIFWNTLAINLYLLIIGFPGPIILALLLNEVRQMWFKKSIQTVVYLPHFISWVIVGGMFIEMLSPSTGIINKFLNILGMESISFITSPKYFRSILVATSVWKGIGWGAIVYLAAISGISQELYESAKIDGAGKFKQTWHITLPGIRSTVVVMLILNMGHMMNVGFEHVFVFLTPFTYDVGEVFSTYVYRVGLQSMQFSYTTAVELFQSIISLILVLSANKIANKFGDGGIW